jgi:hypothetical protein
MCVCVCVWPVSLHVSPLRVRGRREEGRKVVSAHHRAGSVVVGVELDAKVSSLIVTIADDHG